MFHVKHSASYQRPLHGKLDDTARLQAEQNEGDNAEKQHPAGGIAPFVALSALFDEFLGELPAVLDDSSPLFFRRKLHGVLRRPHPTALNDFFDTLLSQ